MVAVTGAAVLAAAGCGGGQASPNAAAPTGATPTAAFSKPPSFTKMRFSAATFACKPKADPEVSGAWETKAPRFRVKPGAPVTLGLSNTGGNKTPMLAVVYAASGAHAYAKATVKGSWSTAVFPKDFVSASSKKRMRSYPKGIYTVVWVTQQGHKFISCDGFATIGAKQPKPRATHSEHATAKHSPSTKKTG